MFNDVLRYAVLPECPAMLRIFAAERCGAVAFSRSLEYMARDGRHGDFDRRRYQGRLMSIWQLLIILLLVGAPVAMYFIISGGPRGEIQRPLKFLHGSFWSYVVAGVLLVASALAVDDTDSIGGVLASLFVVLNVASWSFLISLGVLASRTGRSWILWAGLTFITGPLGTILSYFAMSNRIKDEQVGRRAPADV
jgi:hypothetical protein